MDEIYTTEVYWYSTFKEAQDAMIKMMIERPCLTQCTIDASDKAHVKLTVGVGESR